MVRGFIKLFAEALAMMLIIKLAKIYLNHKS